MNCFNVVEKLSFYIDGVLDEHTLEQIEAHLAECEYCRNELASLKMLVQASSEIDQVTRDDC